MKTQKNDAEYECRKRLRPFVKELVRATPDRRRQLALRVLDTATRPTMRMLTELLIERLDDDKSHAGAAATLVALGPPILPTLGSALLAKQSEQCLLHLASIAVTVGQMSQGKDRDELRTLLLIASGLAPSQESRFLLEEAAWLLREDIGAEAEPESDLPAQYGV